MASEVNEKPVDIVPDLRQSAATVQQEIRKYYYDLGLPVPPQASDVAGLAESLASILSPLYEDIHSTFALASTIAGVPAQLLQKAAQ
jgi:multidrug resistance protein MdtO